MIAPSVLSFARAISAESTAYRSCTWNRRFRVDADRQVQPLRFGIERVEVRIAQHAVPSGPRMKIAQAPCSCPGDSRRARSIASLGEAAQSSRFFPRPRIGHPPVVRFVEGRLDDRVGRQRLQEQRRVENVDVDPELIHVAQARVDVLQLWVSMLAPVRSTSKIRREMTRRRCARTPGSGPASRIAGNHRGRSMDAVRLVHSSQVRSVSMTCVSASMTGMSLSPEMCFVLYQINLIYARSIVSTLGRWRK